MMKLLFDYVVALTNLNGVVDKEKVLEIYNLQNEPGRTAADIDTIMIKNEKELREHFVEMEGKYFVHESIMGFDEIESWVERKSNKPYYIPEKKLLLRYKDDEFYEETKQTKSLFRFLNKHVKPSNVNSIEDVFYEILIFCEMETPPSETISRLQQIGVTFSTRKDLEEALYLITDLYNHTRLWSNNGFTPAEIFEKVEKPSLKPQEKIGRNDPCPCGSGKKYKKCCLLKA